MSDKTYNGWTNYATWRVNLEVFDGMDADSFDLSQQDYALADDLKEYVESYIDESTPDGIAKDYAMAFLDDVNWREIAEHMIQSCEDE